MSSINPFDALDVPAETRPFLASLAQEHLRPAESLRREVLEYREVIHRAACAREFLDTRLAESLAVVSLALLDTLTADTPEHTHRLIQVAVRYFVLDEDAESDLDSLLGFDDDAAVMNAAVRHLGREDLVIEIA